METKKGKGGRQGEEKEVVEEGQEEEVAHLCQY